MISMIRISNISKSYDKKVLDDINIEIKDGTLFGLVGVNGSGKTTLLNIMSGLYKPDCGFVTYDDVAVFGNDKLRKDIFYLSDDPFYDRKTTPKSLVDEYKLFYKINEREYYDYISEFDLPENVTMKNFSKGMKRLVFISLALAVKPKYLLLDEVFDGLDSLSRKKMLDALFKLQEQNNMTVILTSHSLRELSGICDSFGMMQKGKIVSYSNLEDYAKKYHRYTMAFDAEIQKTDFEIDFIDYNQSGKFVSCITELEYDEMEKMVKPLSPIVLEEEQFSLEEFFLVENSGKEMKKC